MNQERQPQLPAWPSSAMSARIHAAGCLLLLVALLAAGFPPRSEAKSYSSGSGRSYSSSSSHSSSSGGSHSSSSGGSSHSSSSGGGSHSASSSGNAGKSSGTATHSSGSQSSGSKSFNSGSGKSYSAGSSSTDDGRRGYTSSKSYTSGSGHTFSSSSSSSGPARPGGAGFQPAIPNSLPPKPGVGAAETGNKRAVGTTPPEGRQDARPATEAASPSSFSFDNPAARARKEEASRQEFTRFKESSAPKPPVSDRSIPPAATPSYRVTPPPLPPSASGSYRRPAYVPDTPTILSRPARTYNVFYPYVSRPVVVYRDSYNSFFWWWLLDRTLDDRASWAYHHRYDMDPARYQALVADNHQLEERITQLETQQVARDPNYVPPGLDRDLMYSDRHVTQAYSNRPTASGKAVFWVLAIPLALGAGWFFVWLIFLKRWQPAT